MTKYLVAYAVCAILLIAIDSLWLGLIAKTIYQQGIGHLMAERPNFWVAALFYCIFALGLMLFAVVPHETAPGWQKTLTAAALFGFFTYATYDLSNLATLKSWPVGVSVLDISWGVAVSVLSAAAGKAALDKISTG